METEKLSRCLLCNSPNLVYQDEAVNLVACTACGYVFDNPRPTAAAISDYYSRNDKYDGWLANESGRALLWRRRLALVKKFVPRGSLLDVGTGIGQFLDCAKNDFTVSGTEVSQSAIAIAKEKYGILVTRGQIEELNYPEPFDVVTLYHVLEHVPSPRICLEKVRTLLKDEGVLIVAVPNDLFSVRTVLIALLRMLHVGKFRYFGRSGIRKLALDGSLSEIHLSHFKPEVLRSFIEKQGFEILFCGLDPYYSARGVAGLFHKILYLKCKWFFELTKINFYPTIMVVARKKTKV